MSDKIREAFDAWRSSKGYTRPDDPGEWEAWQAALAQQPAPTVPDGWKLVPVEPTIDMEDAGRKAASGFMRLGEAGRVFRAMLAASPAAPAPAPAAQEPVAFYWQDLDAFPMTARRHGPYFGWPSEDAIARCQHYAKPVPLYAAPPAAEQPKCITCRDSGIVGHSDVCPACADTWTPAAESAEQSTAIAEAKTWCAENECTPAEFLSHQLLVKRCEVLGRALTWREAIELTALTTNMPEAERDALIALDDDEQPDTVKVPRERLLLIADALRESIAESWAERELRAVLGKEGA